MSHSTERTHLSIREVLEVLVGEFPDVTISKIRFLESRGLIHPERTPAGYRRFYQSDVERLRWILQQQREHFLPLKVIKGRLERDTPFEPSLFDAEVSGYEPDEATLAGASSTGESLTLGGVVAGATASLEAAPAGRIAASGARAARGGAAAGRASASAAGGAQSTAGGQHVVASGAGTVAVPNGAASEAHAPTFAAQVASRAVGSVGAGVQPAPAAPFELAAANGTRRTVGLGEQHGQRAGAVSVARQYASVPAGDRPSELAAERRSVATVERSRATSGAPASSPAGESSGSPTVPSDGEAAAQPTTESPRAASRSSGGRAGREAGAADPPAEGPLPAASSPAPAGGGSVPPGAAGAGGRRQGGVAAQPRAHAGAVAARQGTHGAQPATGGGAAEPSAPSAQAARGIHRVVTGASFSGEELAVAASVEPALVDELVEYGLIAGREVAGIRVYDEDALLVTRVASAFRRFGIECRHLKSLKHAAEREAGLYEQVVTPLLRQRNPQSHERAVNELREMAELGAALRAHFLEAELRHLTGG